MKIGDWVSVINDDLNGKIKSIQNDCVIIIDSYGFSHQYSKKDLIVRNQEFYENNLHTEGKYDKISREKPNKSRSHQSHLILDLHFDKLVNNPHQYDSFERFFIQKEKLIETLEFCRENKIRKLEIVHGIGDGILQKMVYDILRTQTNMEFEEHEFFYHQSGSVLVVFKN